MKIEKLNENSIQIELSVDEMEKRSLSISSLNTDDPAYKELVQNMISYAEIELGHPVSAVTVNSQVNADRRGISFLIESMQPDDVPDDSITVPQDAGPADFGRKKTKEQARHLSPVYKRVRPRQTETATESEIPSQDNPGGKGFDLTAELMRRMMIDSYLFIHASAMKAAMEKGESGAENGDDILSGPKNFQDEQGFSGTEESDDNTDQNRESLSKVFEMRRKIQFGDDYEETGGS